MLVDLTMDVLELDAKTQRKTQADGSISLHDVRALAEKQLLLEEEVAALEAQVILKKAELRQVAEHELPEMLNLVGLPSITLADGSIIQIVDNISASISDDNREAAHTWLRDKGFGDLIKNNVTVTFGKGEDKDAQLLIHNIHVMADQGALHFGALDQKEAVHNSTLKAFIKERLKAGEELPAETFKLFVGQIARIKKHRLKE